MGEAFSVSRLMIIMAHSNVEKTVGAIQERIFSRFGLTSAIALPPVVPLRFVSSPGGVHPPRGMTVRTTAYETEGCSLYLGVELRVGEKKLESADILDAAGKGEAEPAACRAVPFPDHTGFYLCTTNDAALLPAVVEDISPPPRLDFHPLGVALLTLKYLSTQPWWSHLSWEIDSLQIIRKQRKGSHGKSSSEKQKP
jgi:hypothetical protein